MSAIGTAILIVMGTLTLPESDHATATLSEPATPPENCYDATVTSTMTAGVYRAIEIGAVTDVPARLYGLYGHTRAVTSTEVNGARER